MSEPTNRIRWLCTATFKDVAVYIQNEISSGRETQLVDTLWDATEHEAVTPSVNVILLSITQTPSVIVRYLKSPSCLSRRHAIERFSRYMARREGWREIWDAIGQLEGFLCYLEQTSAHDVKSMMKSLRKNIKVSRSTAERQAVFTDLVKVLLFGEKSANSGALNTDNRAMDKHYRRLLPLCTHSLLEEYSKAQGDSAVCQRILLHNDPYELQNLAMKLILNPGEIREPLSDAVLSMLFQKTPAGRSESGWSESMEFSFRVLRAIENHEGELFDRTETLMEIMVQPLLRRIDRRKACRSARSKALREQALHMALNLYERVKPNDISFISAYVTSLWKAFPSQYEPALVRVFELERQRNADIELGKVEDRLEAVPVPLRYRYTELACKHLIKQRVDLSAPADDPKLVAFSRNADLHLELFTDLLDNRNARKLLLKLIDASNGELKLWTKDFGDIELWSLDFGSSFWTPKIPGVYDPDLEVLSIYLSFGSDPNTEPLKLACEIRRQRAEQCGDPKARGGFVRAALVISVATGHPEIFARHIKWAHRYVRDPMVLTSTLLTRFDEDSPLEAPQATLLMCGMAHLLPATDKTALTKRIADGNQALLNICHLHQKARREPGVRFDSNRILKLGRRIVEQRLSHAKNVQDMLGLSEDEMKQSVWGPTLDTMIEVESTILEGLENDSYERGSSLSTTRVDMRRCGPSAYWFLARWGQAKHDIWLRDEIRRNPEKLSNPVHWPRGLPIEAFPCPSYSTKDSRARISMSRLTERCEEILFMPKSTALSPPPPEGYDEAFGSVRAHFYKPALSCYVLLGTDANERVIFARKAWDHAVTEFSADGMTESEAFNYWKAVFPADIFKLIENDVKPPKVPVKSPLEYQVHLPNEDGDDLNGILEWNPTSQAPSKEMYALTDRELTPCFINWLVAPLPRHRPIMVSHYGAIDPEDQRWTQANKAWEACTDKQDRASVEGKMAAALLWLDSKKGGSDSLLAKPFPESTHAKRFPCVFLDDRFLSQVADEEIEWVCNTIRRDLRQCPVSLMVPLAKACFDLFKTRGDVGWQRERELESLLVGILRIAGRSDQPAKAANLIVDVVLGLPESSSWHRSILHEGLLASMSKDEVALLLTKVGAGLGRLSKEQKKHQPETPSEYDELGKPLVKISTLKLFARLFSREDLVEPEMTLNMLKMLLADATHVDVQAAAIASLASLAKSLEGKRSQSATLDQIRQVLISLVPILGSTSERKPLNESGWVEAENSETFPAVNEQCVLWDKCLDLSKDSKVSPEYRQFIVRDVLLPALELSIANNVRWMKHYAAVKDIPGPDHYPVGPIRPKMLSDMVKFHPQSLTRGHLELYQQLRILNLKRSESLEEAYKRVDKDRQSSKDPDAAMHWRGQINPSWHFVNSLPVSQTFRPQGPVDEGLDIQLLQAICVEWGRELLSTKPFNASLWGSFLSDMSAELTADRNTKSRQVHFDRLRPIFDGLLFEILTQKDNPAFFGYLPSDTPLRLLISGYSWRFKEPGVDSGACGRSYLHWLSDLINKVCSDTKRPEPELDLIRDQAGIARPEKVKVAIALGTLTMKTNAGDSVSLNEYRVLYFVSNMISGNKSIWGPEATAEGESLRTPISQMIKTWRDHGDRDVRNLFWSFHSELDYKEKQLLGLWLNDVFD